MRYRVKRTPGALTFYIWDSKTATIIPRLTNTHGETGISSIFDTRVEAARVCANLNRAEVADERRA